MLHKESLLKDLFEDDQRDRMAFFEIRRQIMNLDNVKNIPEVINKLNEFKSEARHLFGEEFELHIQKLKGIAEQSDLNKFKLEFDLFIKEKLNNNDSKRRQEVTRLMPKITQKTAEDYYYAAVIYNHGSSPDDAKLAYDYAGYARDLIKPYDNSKLSQDIRNEYMFTYDRYQLAQGNPQRYGTSYSPQDNEAKGWEADKLVPPYKDYIYHLEDRLNMNKARKELGVESLEQQEETWGVPKKNYPTLKPGKSNQNEDKESEEEIKPKPAVCSNCGEEGHLAVACLRPSKPR